MPVSQSTKKVDSTFPSLLLYLLLALTPIVLKLAERTRVATWSWWKVTAVLWAPWLLLVLVSVAGWLLFLWQNRRG